MRPRPLWRNRLSVRVTLIIALTLFVFELAGGPLRQTVFRWLDLPGPEDGVILMSEPDSDQMTLPLAPLGDLLEDAERLQGGEWIPTDGALERAARALPPDFAFLFADPELVVAAAAGGFEAHIGTQWRPGRFPIEFPHPIYSDGGELAGWWITFADALGPALRFSEGEGREPPPLPDEFVRLQRRMERVARITSIVLLALAALFLGALVSRLVTARLTQLANAAAREEEHRFDVGGADEIASLAADLGAARQRSLALVRSLEDRDRERQEWIAQVSHDLRTPLFALQACLDRAQSSSENPQLSKLLGTARQDAHRVRELADDLLEVARLRAGAPIERESILVGELVERVARGLTPTAEARGIELKTCGSERELFIEADGRRLSRALENLIQNALRFAESRVTVSIQSTSGVVTLAVRDDGPGFNNGVKRDPDSAGIGLEVVRRVAQSHGGELVTSPPEAVGGAVAKLVLPEEGPPAWS